MRVDALPTVKQQFWIDSVIDTNPAGLHTVSSAEIDAGVEETPLIPARHLHGCPTMARLASSASYMPGC
jgi:hypothetical protein